jgi:outer membrane protein OmpA-like peptidoglycan-associated protein
VERKLAVSYYIKGEWQKSEEYYGKVYDRQEKNAEDIWNFAQILMQNGNYSKSTQVMQEFIKVAPGDKRAMEYSQAGDFVSNIKSNESNFTIANIGINSDHQDFATSYYKNQVVFASSRHHSTAVNRKWNGNQLPFLDLYVADLQTAGELSEPLKFPKSVNKKFHEGPVSFNKNGDFMVLTRDNYEGKSSDGVKKLQLFTYEYKDEKWSSLKAFPFNNSEYSVGHASLTSDGKTMYFASDMPGGKGGVDIYISKMDGSGSWSTPENLTAINTEGNEMFPFFHEGGLLFFASNGHVGLGGLDIFVSQLKDGKPGKFLNAGSPLNTNHDDFGMIVNEEMKQGYLSSNRDGGKGNDDIYYFTMKNPYTFGKTIKGKTTDKEGNLLPDATVELMKNNEVVQSVKSDANGNYEFLVDEELEFGLGGTKEKYFDGKNKANTDVPEDVIYADLVLEKDPGLSLYAIVTDKKSKEVLSDVKLTILDNMTGDETVYNTPATGDYLRPLNDKKLNDRGSYNIKLEKEGYFTKTVTYNEQFTKPGKYEVHGALDLGLDPEVKDLAELVQINPINFDKNKFKIRPDAAIELDKIVEVMNKYPNMIVELGAHTDCRAPKAYNEKLSDQRAKASAEYIKKKITSPERIYGKGYGESEILNGCECEGAVKATCTEEEHEKNRRTEFKVISTGNDKVKVTNTSTNSFGK